MADSERNFTPYEDLSPLGHQAYLRDKHTTIEPKSPDILFPLNDLLSIIDDDPGRLLLAEDPTEPLPRIEPSSGITLFEAQTTPLVQPDITPYNRTISTSEPQQPKVMTRRQFLGELFKSLRNKKD